MAATGLVLVLGMAACGSQLEPDEVAAFDGTGDAGEPVILEEQDGTGLTTDPGTTTGQVPGDTSLPPTTSTGGDTGSTTGGATPGASGGDEEAPANAAGGDGKGGACDGFKNQTGITDDTITLANASDISGPVPGLFESAQQGAQAYVEYFNSTSDICGRKLKLILLDSKSDAAGDQAAYTRACAE